MSSVGRQLAPSKQEWSHRPHLDGIRAVAVYLVVLYHAGLAWMPGGFIGVDLFFVLSGYLVTNVLLMDLAEFGTVRVARFLARRARRLLPAASVCIVGTCLAALMLLPSLDRSTMTGDSRAASLWFANWHFLAESSDYFNEDIARSPFLHFWSLAIEEQFYLVYPVVILLVWRVRPRLRSIAIVASTAAIISLALQLYFANEDVNRAYLGTDSRIYQVLAGSLLAMWVWSRSTPVIHEARAVRRLNAALTPLIVACFVLSATSLVGASASARGVLASSLAVVLIFVLERQTDGTIRRVLSTATLQYLGRISYGTYLWHFPVLVLSMAVLEITPPAAAVLSGVGGTALAALSAEVVEQPVRFARSLDKVPIKVVTVGIGLAATVGLLLAPTLLDSHRRPIVSARGAVATRFSSGKVPALDWQAIARQNPAVPECQQDNGSDCFIVKGGGPVVLLIGDSHSRMLVPAVTEVAHRNGWSLAVDYAPSCPWQLGLLAGEPGDRFSPACAERRPSTYEDRLAAIDPDVVLLASYPRGTPRADVYSDRAEYEGLDPETLTKRATVDSVARLVAADTKVIAIEPLPVLESNPLSCLSAATDLGECSIPPLPEGVEEGVLRGLESSRLIDSVDLDPAVCDHESACSAMINGVVVRRDSHHLTNEFALSLVDELEAALLHRVSPEH